MTKRDSVVVPGLENAVQHSRLFVPAVDSEPSYYEVATAHRGNVVVVLEWQASGNAAGDGGQDWTWTAERLDSRPGRGRRLTGSAFACGDATCDLMRQPAVMTSRIRRAVSDGVLPTLTPTASSASFFAAAVPDEPDTIAPAWPIVLPSGAVKPAT